MQNVRAKKCSLILDHTSLTRSTKKLVVCYWGLGRIAQASLPLVTDCTKNKVSIPRLLANVRKAVACKIEHVPYIILG
eukprot:scaffold256_cov159-Amphora_coffeaeformis.AAC.2